MLKWMLTSSTSTSPIAELKAPANNEGETRHCGAASAALGKSHRRLGLRLGLRVTPWPRVGGLPTYATHHRALAEERRLAAVPASVPRRLARLTSPQFC